MTSRTTRGKVVVGSGWWSDHSPHDWTIGTQEAHTPAFFSLWLKLVKKYVSPSCIVVTDSHAPLKPSIVDRAGVEWIELDQNYGHSNDIRIGRISTKHSGFTRSLFLGATYAIACDADYYVYVEQDCVIHGDGILDAIVAGMEHPIALGARTSGGQGIEGRAAPMFQQSLIVVARSGLERFISAILSAPETDGELPPEEKLARDLAPFSELCIPFGRSRPLDFSYPHFYAQHLTAVELASFLALEKKSLSPSCVSHKGEPAARIVESAFVASPALRELFITWRRRPDLRDAYSLSTEADITKLLTWALVFGVNEEPALAELSSELALAAQTRSVTGHSVASLRAPKAVHLVSMLHFPKSFLNCAESLERGLQQGGLTVTHYRDATAATLSALAQSGPDEVVHVTGQTDILPLLFSEHSNWVVTIHGAAPYSLPPDLHVPPDAALEGIRAYAARLPRVICPTFNARREISAAYGIAVERIDPIPHFFDFNFFAPHGTRFDAGGRYFLMVSSYQPKKNYVAVLEAFHSLVSQDGFENTLLLIAGVSTPSLLQLLEESFARWPLLNGRVQFAGYAENLADLYRGALALVSMAHQEGFGMPYIEAALCGTPVIGPKRSMRGAAWTSQPTQEIMGSAGLYVDPLRPLDLTTMMAALAHDEELRSTVADRCLRRARDYVDPTFLFDRYLHAYSAVI